MKMKFKTLVILVTLIALVCGGLYIFKGDTFNKWKRKGVEFKKGDYTVISSLPGGHTTVYNVVDGKVTSKPENGYYFFWHTDETGFESYTQTPIRSTDVQAKRPK